MLGCSAPNCSEKVGKTSNGPALSVLFLPSATGQCDYGRVGAQLNNERVALVCTLDNAICKCEGGDQSGSYEVWYDYDDYVDKSMIGVRMTSDCELVPEEVKVGIWPE
jgi:hypothetical protein